MQVFICLYLACVSCFNNTNTAATITQTASPVTTTYNNKMIYRNTIYQHERPSITQLPLSIPFPAPLPPSPHYHIHHHHHHTTLLPSPPPRYQHYYPIHHHHYNTTVPSASPLPTPTSHPLTLHYLLLSHNPSPPALNLIPVFFPSRPWATSTTSARWA